MRRLSARPRPEPLRGFSVQIPVRFAECDAYGVVWHGHYALYLEQAREALTARFGFTATRALSMGYRVPITRMEIRYRLPIFADSLVLVTARLRPPDVARFLLDYEVRGESGALLASAETEAGRRQGVRRAARHAPGRPSKDGGRDPGISEGHGPDPMNLKFLTAQGPPGSRQRSLGFLIRFVVFLVVFYFVVASKPVNDSVIVPFTGWIASASGKVLNVLGERVHRQRHGDPIGVVRREHRERLQRGRDGAASRPRPCWPSRRDGASG